MKSPWGRLLTFAVLVCACGTSPAGTVTIDPTDRLEGSTVLGEWNTAGNTDGWTTANAANLSIAGGILAADDTSTTANATVSLSALTGGPDLDLGFNDYLQIRMKLPAGGSGEVKFEFGTTTKNGFATDRVFTIPAAEAIRDGQFHSYRIDVGLVVWWRDSLRDLRITPILNGTGHFEIDYVEVGDDPGTAPALNTSTNFLAPLTASNTTRMLGKHVCVWWDPNNTSFTTTHARRAIRMCEESYQVFCRKLGYNEPFREFNSTTTTRYKINFITWYDGYWAGGWANRGHMNVGASGLADEGWGNPVPHEFGHVVQMAQFGALAGGHWESHANYLRAQRNLHFYATISSARPAIDNLTGNSNYRPDHKRHIYADQRYYLGLDDYGTQFGLPGNFAAAAWIATPSGKTLIEKLAAALPAGTSVKDVACETLKHWPMLDFVEKTKLRSQHWGTTTDRNKHFWQQGAQLIPLQDKPGWWRVPLERAPDGWAYQMHELTATAGATVTAEVRGLDMPGTGEDWRWCFAAISAGDTVRYSAVWAPGTQSFALTASETQVFLIVTATPASTVIDLESLSNTKPIDKHSDRLRYGYEVRLVNAAPSPHQFTVSNPTGYRTHGNGGGIVGPSATVASTAYVGPNAKVLGSAQVLGNARIEDYAVVQGSAVVQDSAVVSGFALAEGSAKVQSNARVRDRAFLTNGAIVRGRALVAGYSKIENTTVQDDAIVRGCSFPLGGTISGTGIMDHDYSMGSSVSNGVHFSHVPWGDWWDLFYPQTQTKPRGLIAGYRTEESSGELWWDEFGAQHAFLRGAPTRTTDSTLGTSVISLDGVDDYAAFDRSLADTPLFSFSCWIKPATAAGADEPILFLGSSATRALQVRRNASGNASFSISNGTTTRSLTSVSDLPQNVWRHVAVTLDGTNGKLYLNGALETSAAVTLKPLDVLAANHHTAQQANYLGRDWNGALCNASFDDVRFHNVALTAAEVREESCRRGAILGQFSASAPADFNGTGTIAQSGIRNGKVRTLSAWVKPRTSSDVSQYEPVFDSANERDSAKGSGIGTDNGKWVARLDGSGLWNTGVAVVLNQWQHVALAFNGSTATLFVNGVQAATKTYSGPSSDSAAAGKCYRIGFTQTSEDTATRQYFDGLILNARVYDRALSASQLTLDADGDGALDPDEIAAGANPLDASSFPELCWDGADTTANADGGSGTWNTTTTNWDATSTGGTAVAWPTTGTNNVAVFGGTAGTVSLGTDVSVAGLTFRTGGYTLRNNTITFHASGSILANAGTSNLASNLTVTGSAIDLNVTGGGTLNYSGSSWQAYKFTVNGGTTVNWSGTGKVGSGTAADGTNGNYVGLGNAGGGGTLLVTAGNLTIAPSTDNTTRSFFIGNNHASPSSLHVSGGTVTVSANASIRIAAGLNSTTADTAATAGTITVSGTGTFTTGTTTGLLMVGRNNFDTATINLDSGGTFETIRNFTTGTGSAAVINFNGGMLRAAGAVSGDWIASGITTNVLAGGVIIDSHGFDVTINRALLNVSGTDGGLRKLGTGTLTLGGTSTYNGGTIIQGGTVVVANDRGLGSVPSASQAANITLDGGTLKASGAPTLHANRGIVLAGAGGGLISGSGRLTVSGPISGNGKLTLAGAGTSGSDVLLATTNSYTGGTVLTSSAFLPVIGDNSLGTGPIELAGGQIRAATSVTRITLANPVNISADTTFYNYNASNSDKDLIFAGPVTLAGGSRVLTVNTKPATGNTGIFLNGVVSDGGSGFGITKAGTGTLTLGGINTYTGDTRVTGGTLAVTGSSIADSNKVVLDGGKLNLAAGANERVAKLSFGLVPQAAGTYGSSTSGAAFKDDTRFSGTGILTVTLGLVSSDYEEWARATLANPADWSPSADPDRDGMSNGQEHAFGLNPKSGSSCSPVVIPLDPATGTFRYTRRKTTGLRYKVWTSESLGGWTEDAAALQSASSINAETERVDVTLSGNKPLTAKRIFARVSAE